VYTIGGTNPDFANFSQAATVLNSAGVACPVVFMVRDGIYSEQVILYDIPGTSAINTVRFEGESADSSMAKIVYETPNATNDFAVALRGTKHLTFKHLGIERPGLYYNYPYSVEISDFCESITLSNCLSIRILSENTEKFSLLNTYINEEYGFGEIIVQNNQNLLIDNCDLGYLYTANSAHIILNNNNSNNINFSGNYDIQVTSNHLNRITNSEDTLVNISNNFFTGNSSVISSYCKNISIVENQVTLYQGANGYEIFYTEYCDSSAIKQNQIIGLQGNTYSNNTGGNAIYTQSNFGLNEISNNTIRNINLGGILCYSYGNSINEISSNIIDSINYNGINLYGDNIQCYNNKISNLFSGIGIRTYDTDVNIYNNYIVNLQWVLSKKALM
jgi:hypothetical protein